MELKGRVAIITGAGRGIGRATALQLGRAGCSVVLSARSQRELQDAAEEIERQGARALPLALDLSRDEEIETLFNRTIERFAGLDILINNAGVLFPSSLESVTAEEFDQTFAVNVRSVFLLSKKALAIMKERKSGYIINVSSPAAFEVSPALAAYGSSKKAVIGLSQAFYHEAKKHGIKVSTVYPGYTDTKMLRGIPNVKPTPDQWLRPEDIAQCVLFLLEQSERVIVRDLTPLAFGAERSSGAGG
jgi:NAD(P)-dependent dehydrogenase (short-subunit alcohol dehydrogenase family)